MNDATIEQRAFGENTIKGWKDEETLVADTRASFTPSQLVEQKLIHLLRGSPLLVSQIQRRLKPGPR